MTNTTTSTVPDPPGPEAAARVWALDEALRIYRETVDIACDRPRVETAGDDINALAKWILAGGSPSALRPPPLLTKVARGGPA